MKDSYVEEIANQSGPESCVYAGNHIGEALTGGDAGQVLSRENLTKLRGADAMDGSGRQHQTNRYCEIGEDPARSETLCMYPSISRGSREVSRLTGSGIPIRIGNALSENYSLL